MPKKNKKQNKTQVALVTLEGLIASLQTRLAQEIERRRYEDSAHREVISKQTDRIVALTTRLDQVVGQVNGGFQNVKQDLIRAGQGLQSHESDIASLAMRVSTLETQVLEAASRKNGKR